MKTPEERAQQVYDNWNKEEFDITEMLAAAIQADREEREKEHLQDLTNKEEIIRVCVEREKKMSTNLQSWMRAGQKVGFVFSIGRNVGNLVECNPALAKELNELDSIARLEAELEEREKEHQAVLSQLREWQDYWGCESPHDTHAGTSPSNPYARQLCNEQERANRSAHEKQKVEAGRDALQAKLNILEREHREAIASLQAYVESVAKLSSERDALRKERELLLLELKEARRTTADSYRDELVAPEVRDGGPLLDYLSKVEAERDALRKERDGLLELMNTPEIEDFDKAVPLEAAHQVQRWTAAHDAGKKPSDWFWLVGYLAGKALHACTSGDTDKAKHHCISTAAALRNWHAHIRNGTSAMRPGISAEVSGEGPEVQPAGEPK